MKPLVIATGNQHKLSEYQSLLPDFSVTSLAAFPRMETVDETAPDFVGNAILKAKAAWRHTGEISLADDSGLCVHGLDGKPGVRSARFAPGSDRDRCFAVWAALPENKDHRAWFACAIAVAGLPDSLEIGPDVLKRDGCLVVEGRVNGRIIRAFRGQNGFGYDPIFELSDGRTAAELSASEKHAISHRGVACRKIAPTLAHFFIDG